MAADGGKHRSGLKFEETADEIIRMLGLQAGPREGWRSILHGSWRSKADGTNTGRPDAEENRGGRRDTERWRQATPSFRASAIAFRVFDLGPSWCQEHPDDGTLYLDGRRGCRQYAHVDALQPCGRVSAPCRAAAPEKSSKPAADRPPAGWSVRRAPVSARQNCRGPSGPASPEEAAPPGREFGLIPRRSCRIGPARAPSHRSTLRVSRPSGLPRRHPFR